MKIADRCGLKWKWLSISIHPTLSRFKRNAVDYQVLRITFTFTSTCYNGSKFTKIYDMHDNFHDSMILWQLSKACWIGLPNKISRFFSRIVIFNFDSGNQSLIVFPDGCHFVNTPRAWQETKHDSKKKKTRLKMSSWKDKGKGKFIFDFL